MPTYHSRSNYTGDGSTTQWAVSFPFLSRDHVKVYLDEVEEAAWTWISDGVIDITTAPANGVAISIRRSTPIDSREVDWSDGSTLTETDLDNADLQLLYIIQEQADQSADILAGTVDADTLDGIDSTGFALASHSHTLADVSDSGTAAALNVPASGDAAAGEVVKGDDTRLTDARTPVAHTHVVADVTDAGTAATHNVPATGDAAAGEVVKGDDTRLTDARTPTAHTHVKADITDFAHTHVKADVTDLDAIEHGDIAEAEGMVRKTAANSYEAIKSNLTATVAPTATDDTSAGYGVGSIWIDTVADLFYFCVDATAGAAVWSSGGGAGGGGGGPTSVQVFTASGTYTKTAGTTKAEAIVIAGGGGGGGADLAASGDASAGGGSGGGTAIKLFTDVATIDGQAITVGAGGAGGINGAQGTAGGNSSIGAIISATGGSGGFGRTSSGASGAAAAGVGSGGDINLRGGVGLHGMAGTQADNVQRGGQGGGTHLSPSGGVGGVAWTGNTEAPGAAPASGAYGAGGGGGACVNSTLPANGGDGHDGIVIIKEYGSSSGRRYVGARAVADGTQTGVDATSAWQPVYFKAADTWDTDGFHDPVTNSDRHTIVANCDKARVTFNAYFAAASGSTVRVRILKNAVGSEWVAMGQSTSDAANICQVTCTGEINVADTDYLHAEFRVDPGGDTTVDVNAVSSFSIEIIDGSIKNS